MAEPHAPSYYAATATPFAAQPPLAGDAEADVCVVGGGFTGLSAALSAVEAGFSVILLEANRVGWGASGRSGGQMIPGMRWHAGDLVNTFGAERARTLFTVATTARSRVHHRIAMHGIDCDLRGGHLTAACKPRHFVDMQREVECLQHVMGYDAARLIEPALLPDYVGSALYHGGLFDADGGHLHPLNYAIGLAKAALDAGVVIHEDSAATGIDHGRPVVVTTPRGRVTARHAVLACDSLMGSAEPDLARYTMPVGNYNVATEPLGEDAARRLIPSGAAVSDSRFVLNYYRLSADNRLIFGGGEKYSLHAPVDIVAFVRPYLEEVFPGLRDVRIDYGWGGLVGVTMNRLPHFGRVGNSFFAHGYSGQGVLLSTLAGEMIAEAMRGTAERFDIFASLPMQPFPGGRLFRHPLYVVGMLWYALRDRL